MLFCGDVLSSNTKDETNPFITEADDNLVRKQDIEDPSQNTTHSPVSRDLRLVEKRCGSIQKHST